MMCESCKLAADYPDVERGGHSDCYNKTIVVGATLKTREVELNGCFCQHHPVGTRQIQKESND